MFKPGNLYIKDYPYMKRPLTYLSKGLFFTEEEMNSLRTIIVPSIKIRPDTTLLILNQTNTEPDIEYESFHVLLNGNKKVFEIHPTDYKFWSSLNPND
jgi:hypothetical protein